jgi:hypothetical protein
MAQVYHKYVRAGEKILEPAKEQRDRDESDAKFSAARARKEEALADLREAEWKRRSGELIERRTAIHQATFLLITFRQRLLSFATTLPRKLVGKTEHEMRMIIDAQVRECLTELSELPERVTQKQLDYFNEGNGKKQLAERKAPRPGRPGSSS